MLLCSMQTKPPSYPQLRLTFAWQSVSINLGQGCDGMKILLRRSQTRGLFRSVRFKLWGKIELEGDERAIINRYDFDHAVLIFEMQDKLLRWSIIIGFVSLVPLFFIFAGFFGRAIGTPMAIATAWLTGWFFFDRFRMTVYVKDLLHGRHFRCKSVVDLAIKENWLKQIIAYLRAVMEGAKNWDGAETVDVPKLDPDTAKQVMLKRL